MIDDFEKISEVARPVPLLSFGLDDVSIVCTSLWEDALID
jgi:hypothetical protein